jgi:hypothetical protein
MTGAVVDKPVIELNEVPVATPRTGVTNVGDDARTTAPVPVDDPKPDDQVPVVIVPTAVICVCEALTDNVFPAIVNPVPAEIFEAPLN